MSKPKVEVRLSGKGGTVKIEVDHVVGHFAVHPRIVDGKPEGDGYTITHRASGGLIWTTKEEADAIKIAEFLTERKIVPESAAGADAWSKNMTILEKDRLITQLEAIAIRYKSPWRPTT